MNDSRNESLRNTTMLDLCLKKILYMIGETFKELLFFMLEHGQSVSVDILNLKLKVV